MTLLMASERPRLKEHDKLIEVTHKDHTGRVIRISKYLMRSGQQRPVSELIFDRDGNSNLYLYSESGKDVRQVISFDRWSSPG